MIEKIDGFEIYENKQSPRIINIDIGDDILNKLIFPFNKFDIIALEYKPFTSRCVYGQKSLGLLGWF